MRKICLLLHGYLTNYFDLADLPKRLAPYYDYIIYVNLPGHNIGENTDAFTVDGTFNFVEGIINDYIKNSQIDLIGFSMGGALCKYLAVKYPVHKAVLISPSVRYLNMFVLKERIKFIQKSIGEEGKTVKKKVKQEVRENDIFALKFVKENTVKRFNFKNGLIFCKIIDRVARLSGNIKCPLLIIRGDLDEIVPFKAMKECFDLCTHSNKELYQMKNVGHLVLYTQYQNEAIDKIMKFLRG